MEFLIVLVILVAVVFVLTGPLRSVDRVPKLEPDSRELAELEAAREAKYREIRDAELDRATGKLSPEDFTQIEDRLRAEALEILDGIERLTDRGEQDRHGKE